MAVAVKDVRKVVVIEWDLEVVEGKTASIQADGKELRVVPNSGFTNIFYPLNYTGSTEISVHGSKAGVDTGTIEVTGEEESNNPDSGPDGGGDHDMSIAATEFVIVSDERPGEHGREFIGIALEDSAGPGNQLFCQVNVTDEDNGFGWPVSVVIAQLKDLGAGKVGA